MFKLPISGNTRDWFILIAMCFCAFAVCYTTTATLNSLSVLAQDLTMSPTALQWIVNSYSLTTGAFIIAAGQLGDRFTYRRALYIGITIFLIATILIPFAKSGPWIIMGRAIQGLGAAFISPLSLSLIKFNFSEGDHAKKAIAIWSATVALGFSLGPIVGGTLTTLFNWRAIFWFTLIVILIGTLLLAITPAKPKTNHSKAASHFSLDFVGLFLLILGIVPLILGLSEGNNWGWGNDWTWVIIIAGLVILIRFFFVERKKRHPLVNFRHFRQRLFVVALIGQGCTMTLTVTLLYYFNIYAQTPALLDYTVVQSGLAMLPMSLLVFIISFIAPGITKRFGYRFPTTGGFILAAVGFYLLHNVPLNVSYMHIWPALICIGIGIGIPFSSLSGLAMTSLPTEEAGQASGILQTDMYLASSLGTAISMICFLHVGRSTVQDSLQVLQGLSDHTKLLIDQAIVKHTVPLQKLIAELPSTYHDHIIEIAKQASLYSFHAAMLYATVIAILGAIVCAVCIRKGE